MEVRKIIFVSSLNIKSEKIKLIGMHQAQANVSQLEYIELISTNYHLHILQSTTKVQVLNKTSLDFFTFNQLFFLL